jgi:hypothetical protein
MRILRYIYNWLRREFLSTGLRTIVTTALPATALVILAGEIIIPIAVDLIESRLNPQ